MKRFLSIVAAVLLLAGGYWVYLRLSPAHQVKTVVNGEIDSLNTGDLASVYGTLSPALQSRCPLPTIERLAAQARQQDPQFASAQVSLRDVRVQVTGNTAQVSGLVLVNGQIVYQIQDSNPLIYVHTANGWSLDSVGTTADAACASGQLPAA